MVKWHKSCGIPSSIKKDKMAKKNIKKVCDSYELILISKIAISGTLKIASAKKPEILKSGLHYFPLDFFERDFFKKYSKASEFLDAKFKEISELEVFLSENSENLSSMLANDEAIKIAKSFKDSFIYPLGKKGINQALWNIAKENNVGIFMYIDDVPLSRETIELSDFYSLNPYDLESYGATIIATRDARLLMKALDEAGIENSLIAKCRKEKKVMIYGNNIKRTLKPPKIDSVLNLK